MKIYKLLSLLFVLSCSTSGPVDTKLDDSLDIAIVAAPKDFHSILNELNQIKINIGRIGDSSSFQYQALLQREDEIISELENIQQAFSSNDGLDLTPGQSYSFKIQSFCVHPGAYRPLIGDGFRVGEMNGKASAWLPQILERLPKVKVNEDKLQTLIWELLSGDHYDDLSAEDKHILNLFFDDSLTRFGSSTLNQIGSTIIQSVIPDEVGSTIGECNTFKNQLSSLHDNFKTLESILVPYSNREKPIPVGWMRIKDGYLLKLTSNDYGETRVDIYVPDESSDRKPQSKTLFKLSNLVALPSVGQRLALSHKLNIPHRTRDDKYCKKLQDFVPKNCSEMSDNTREKILNAANPENFSKTRYSSPPDHTKPIEEESDCSTFTQKIYERAGLSYPYAPTSAFECLNTFEEIDKADSQPGDLVLYSGHIGILSKNEKVISATQGGPHSLSRLPADDPRFLPSITELPKDQFGKSKIYRWRCP